MQLAIRIAKRYLFSRKRQNAINIISMIGIVGMSIGTAALIIILSVFNGIDSLIAQNGETLTPSVTIYPQVGKFATFDSSFISNVSAIKNVTYSFPIVQENAMAKFNGKLRPISVKGIPAEFIEKTSLQNKIVGGEALLKTNTSDTTKPMSIVGYGVAADLKLEFRRNSPLLLYYPNRNASSATNISSLTTITTLPSGVFSFNLEQDNQLVFVETNVAQSLFKCNNQYTKIEIYTADSYISNVKEELAKLVNEDFKIVDKFEENKSFYAMMRGEKFAVFLIMLFVILIASFNTVASISMLMLDKKEDLFTYKSMGFTNKSLINIFQNEGYMIVAFGTIVGLIIGCTTCYLQEIFGFITLGDGNYITSAYPVRMIFSDIIIVTITVMTIGYLATTIPVKYLINKWT